MQEGNQIKESHWVLTTIVIMLAVIVTSANFMLSGGIVMGLFAGKGTAEPATPPPSEVYASGRSGDIDTTSVAGAEFHILAPMIATAITLGMLVAHKRSKYNLKLKSLQRRAEALKRLDNKLDSYLRRDNGI